MAVGRRAVWRLKDSKGNTIAYLKYGTKEEIERTKLFHQIVIQSNFAEKYPLVILEYPQIITEGNPLTGDIKTNIERELDRIKASLWGRNRGKVPFIMTVINTEGFTYYDALKKNNKDFINKKLGGQGLFKDEWEQSQAMIQDINGLGFVHQDFVNNFYVRRNEEGKLVISMLDFETAPNGTYDNLSELETIEYSLNKMGLVKSQRTVTE